MDISMSGQRLYQRLLDLSHNLWWSWQANGIKLWQTLSLELWDQYFHNPIKMLKHLGKEGVIKSWNEELESLLVMLENDWIAYVQQFDPIAKKLPNIAYFSAEFGLHESLATYSGGLGILAGDHLKSASDLGIPLTAIGLLYKQGYVQQQIDHQGKQHSVFLDYHFYDYPIEPVLKQGRFLRGSILILIRMLFFTPFFGVYKNLWSFGRIEQTFVVLR
jgi:starch phosphorylase